MVDVNTTVRLADIVTWAGLVFVGGGAFTWMKTMLTRHSRILFYESGESRVVSFDALDIRRDACLTQRTSESQHVNAEIQRIDIWNGQQVLALSSSIEKLSEKMDKMSTSITVLSVGGKPVPDTIQNDQNLA